MKFIKAAALAAMLGAAQNASAEDISWTQTLDLPIGLNIASGASVDVLGIAPGTTYEQARARLEELAEGRAQVEETISTYSLAGGETGQIRINFPSQLQLKRKLEDGSVDDRIIVFFSAPSSGHQVLEITRSLAYKNPNGEPRIAEVLASMSAKYGSEPIKLPFAKADYIWHFNDGQAISSEPGYGECSGNPGQVADPGNAAGLNDTGKCDVFISASFSPGISDEHTDRISMRVVDLERGKQNLTADFKFFRAYLEQVRSSTSGATPDL